MLVIYLLPFNMFSVELIFAAPDRNMVVVLAIGVEGTGMAQSAVVHARSTRPCSASTYYSIASNTKPCCFHSCPAHSRRKFW